MYPKGEIYPHTTALYASVKVKILYKLLRSSGLFLIVWCLVYAFYCMGPVMAAEVKYSVKPKSTSTPKIVLPETTEANFDQAQAIYQVQHEALELGVNSQFSIVVPKIDASAKVNPNVNPGDYEEYMAALKDGVAHSLGTNFPGEDKLIYLFSHSTNASWWASRYGAEFYLLNKLQKDDKVIVFFADKKYEYSVSEIKIVNPNDTSWLIDQGEGEVLILQTCTPAGTSLKRLIVIAKPSV